MDAATRISNASEPPRQQIAPAHRQRAIARQAGDRQHPAAEGDRGRMGEERQHEAATDERGPDQVRAARPVRDREPATPQQASAGACSSATVAK
jgi:hypothetical protein